MYSSRLLHEPLGLVRQIYDKAGAIGVGDPDDGVEVS